MPSANLSGRPSSTRPEHVEEDFGENFPVLDGGCCAKGLESTILLYQAGRWAIARLGAISPEEFEPILGYQPVVLTKQGTEKPLCPGQLFRHYSPKAKLYLGDLSKLDDSSVILGFKERSYPAAKQVLFLGSISDPQEVAENLYRTLRLIDQEGYPSAWVDMDFPRHGLWQTIAERLLRAGDYFPCA